MSDKMSDKDFNKTLINLKVWERILRLEKAIFNDFDEKNVAKQYKSKIEIYVNKAMECFSDRKQDIDALEKNFKQFKKEYTKTITTLGNEISLLKQKVLTQEEQHENLITENQSLNATLKELKEKKDALSNQLKEKDDENRKLHSRIAELETDLRISKENNDSLTKENSALNFQLESTKKEKIALEFQLKTSQEENNKLTQKSNELDSKLSNTSNELKNIQKQLRKTETDLGRITQERDKNATDYEQRLKDNEQALLSLKLEKQTLVQNKKDLEQDKQDLEQAKQKISDQLLATQTKLHETENTLKNTKKDLTETQCNLANTQKNLEHEQSITKAFQNKFGKWDETTDTYCDLLESLLQCSSLDEMMKAYGIEKAHGSRDIINIIHFVGLLGNQTTFLDILYDYIEDSKEISMEFLDNAECSFFSKLNNYYCRIFDYSYNLIRYPEPGDKFDKAMMKDMENRTKMYRTIEGTYVPAIMRDEYSYLQLALVKGVM